MGNSKKEAVQATKSSTPATCATLNLNRDICILSNIQTFRIHRSLNINDKIL